MFEKTKATIKNKTNKMLGRLYEMTSTNSEVKTISNKSMVKRWNSIYEGKPPWRSTKVQGDNLPAAMVSELSKKATVELEGQLLRNDLDPISDGLLSLIKESRVNIEQLLVQGSGLMVPVYSDEGKDSLIDVSYIPATHFTPLKFKGNQLIEVEIYELIEHKGVTYTRVETHEYDRSARSHTIYNELFKGDLISLETQRTGRSIPLYFVPEFSEIDEVVIVEGVEGPLFVYVKTPYTNNVNINSKLGVSIYAKVEQLLRRYDEAYTTYITELTATKIRIDTPREIAEGILEDEPSDSVLRDVIYPVDVTGEENLKTLATGNLIGVFSPDVREEKFSKGVESILRKIERNAGFSYGALSEVNFIAKTATEIKVGQQTTEQTVADIQYKYEEAIRNIAEKMFNLAKHYGVVSGNFNKEADLSIDWGDSVVDGDVDGVDSDLLLSLVDKNLIKKEEALARIFNCSIEEALLMIPDKNDEIIDEQ